MRPTQENPVPGYRRMLEPAYWPYLLAAVLGCAALVEVAVREAGQPLTRPLGALLALAATAPIALVRAMPVVSAVLIAAVCLISPLIGYPPTVAVLVALGVACYVLGRQGHVRTAGVLIVPFVAYAAAPGVAMAAGGRTPSIAMLAVTAVAAVAGTARRAGAATARHEATDRAIADTLMEHVARGERARIARELHDVVAHHISMIAVQSDAARLTTPGMPAEGARRLVAIGETARAALTEMRRLLGVLREDAGTEVTRRPQPGLHQLNGLLDEARDLSAGSTRLIVHGGVVPLDPGIELVAYRIVQEALTNARRHAAGAAVDVELHYRPGTLLLRVRDNGPGPPPAGRTPGPGGHGLTGMRERAAMVGGSLTAGPAPIGGFLIEAVLPTTGGEE
ncbi:sensor histidine kinase [Amorphoplanes digitatis]|uniref:histidine kinase n=1 Tax=Actinoplanes digitatis TaxID=1868 RepID=A0A7W7I0Y6_9ACTN|nr:sensor histidine kinase [Actinoplanes digitatis]MBB4764340.1 signal transduction histidine kinase [Actinoplanes digitatis]